MKKVICADGPICSDGSEKQIRRIRHKQSERKRYLKMRSLNLILSAMTARDVGTAAKTTSQECVLRATLGCVYFLLGYDSNTKLNYMPKYDFTSNTA